jgi:ubiquinone/menaquinone biosynthesis C-methylase UbiE
MDDDLAETIGTYDRIASEYRERHEDRAPIADQVDQFCEAIDGSVVLDVGCGPGWESATFTDRGFEVLGVDLTPGLLDIATEEAPTADFARMDLRTLGVHDETVDGIWACASFLHVPRSDAHGTLGEFRRVLRDGGTLCSLSSEEPGPSRATPTRTTTGSSRCIEPRNSGNWFRMRG